MTKKYNFSVIENQNVRVKIVRNEQMQKKRKILYNIILCTRTTRNCTVYKNRKERAQHKNTFVFVIYSRLRQL